MTVAITSSFGVNSSNLFATLSVSAFLPFPLLLEIWKMGEKNATNTIRNIIISITAWFISHVPNELLFMLGINIKIIDIMINRTARGQFQSFYPNLLINGSKKSEIGIYQYIPQNFHQFLLTQKILEKNTKDHNLLQLVEDTISFTDWIGWKSEPLESL